LVKVEEVDRATAVAVTAAAVATVAARTRA